MYSKKGITAVQHQSSSSSSSSSSRRIWFIFLRLGLSPTPGRGGWTTTGSWRLPRPAATASSSSAQPGTGAGSVRRVGNGRGSTDGIIPGGNGPKAPLPLWWGTVVPTSSGEDFRLGLRLSRGKLIGSSELERDKRTGCSWSMFRLDGCCGVGGRRRRGGAAGRRAPHRLGSVALRRCGEGEKEMTGRAADGGKRSAAGWKCAGRQGLRAAVGGDDSDHWPPLVWP